MVFRMSSISVSETGSNSLLALYKFPLRVNGKDSLKDSLQKMVAGSQGCVTCLACWGNVITESISRGTQLK